MYYYVIQKNREENSQELLGFNLSESEKDKLFYSLGVKESCSIGNINSDDDHLSNVFGSHKNKFSNSSEAFHELVIKPDAFNGALMLLQKSGYDVVKKGVIGKKQKVVSYQMEKSDIF